MQGTFTLPHTIPAPTQVWSMERLKSHLGAEAMARIWSQVEW